MPLAWAHAEYVKLVMSRELKHPVDRPESVWRRYGGVRPALTRVMWCEHAPAGQLPQGCRLTLALREAGAFRWGVDGWQDVREQQTTASALGLHLLEIDTARLTVGQRIDLTFRHAASGEWIGRDFVIDVTAPGGAP
jgi:glucoamylase